MINKIFRASRRNGGNAGGKPLFFHFKEQGDAPQYDMRIKQNV